MKLSDMGEFGFINRIEPFSLIRSSGVVKGIGDDCAVMDLGGPEYLLLTTDLMVEKVHFFMEWAGPETIGEKALAVNLSDIAACGAIPLEVFVSLAVPQRVDVDWLDGLYKGMWGLAKKHDCNVLGGDTTGSASDLVINISVTGRAPKDRVLYRSAAKPGDFIISTGKLGDSAAGLDLLLRGDKEKVQLFPDLVKAHLSPRPHLEESKILSNSGLRHAAIDVSDGLSSDLGHICRSSGVGALLEESNLPLGNSLTAAALELKKDPMTWVLNGGEAYCLLATVPPEYLSTVEAMFHKEGLELFILGRAQEGADILLRGLDGQIRPISAGGWDHFNKP